MDFAAGSSNSAATRKAKASAANASCVVRQCFEKKVEILVKKKQEFSQNDFTVIVKNSLCKSS